jgi:hypothetical protein
LGTRENSKRRRGGTHAAVAKASNGPSPKAHAITKKAHVNEQVEQRHEKQKKKQGT